MKKYLKEIIILILQLGMFYVFPMFWGPTDIMGGIVLIIISVFILAILMGALSKEKIKYLYPLVIAAVFIPTVYIYYNESAMVHAVWYLVISVIGMLIGVVMRRIAVGRWE